MKKIYKKPLIMVEELTLDHAIAANCDASRPEIESMLEMGYFNIDRGCTFKLFEREGYKGLWEDVNMNGQLDDEDIAYGDSVCYHSNMGKAFLS